jgi:hypothetical protein
MGFCWKILKGSIWGFGTSETLQLLVFSLPIEENKNMLDFGIFDVLQ